MVTRILPTRCTLCKDKVLDPLTLPQRLLRYELTGQDFTRLHVEHFLGMHPDKGALWCCLCSCGTSVITDSSRLVGHVTQSCGCLNRDVARVNIQRNAQAIPRTTRYGDLVGLRFGRLVAQSLAYSKKNERFWHCLCDCKQEAIVSTGHLRRGDTLSCGCLQKERASLANKTHGMRNTSAYKRWCNMLKRCYNPRDKRFPSYGGRGIIVCDRWRHSFENFYADMGNPPHGMTLERKETNGSYSPENCLWDTWRQQRINQRRTVYYSYNGETHHLQEWSKITGIGVSTLSLRLRKLGWNIVKTLTTPVRPLRSKENS